MIILYIILFIMLCLILIKSTSLVIKSLINLSKLLNLSKFFISFVLMAFVTSLPELIVGITSAVSKAPNLSLGNVLGSNIANLTLIFGITAVFAGQISVLRQISLRSASFLFAIALLPLLLIADFSVSRIDGIILLIMFALYTRFLIQKARMPGFCNGSALNADYQALRAKQTQVSNAFACFFKNIALFIVSSGLLLSSAWAITYLAIEIAKTMQLPLFIIGLLGIALGTSLPELVFGVFAVLKKTKQGLYLGNILGSVAVNSSLILGITALIHPIQIQANKSLWLAVVFTILTIAFFNFFMRTKKRISWQEGIILIVFYIVFVIMQSLIK